MNLSSVNDRLINPEGFVYGREMRLMDKMKLGMFAGAVLAALVTMFCINAFVDWLYPLKHEQEAISESAPTAEPLTPGEMPPAKSPAGSAAKEAAGAGDAAPAAEQAEKPLPELLAAANVDDGAKEAKKCAVCHSFEKGAAAKVGPSLYGVLGRPVGNMPGFAYSAAVAGHGGTWDYALLNCYLKDPKACLPGNKMTFAGVKGDEDRANVILFLRSLSDSPAPLPAQ
jgi:cytochrome c